MHSERNYWDAGQHTEWCGAMVDSLHVNIRGLARRFDLALLDTHAARPPGARDTCYLDGRYYAMSEADRDFSKIYPILQEQLGKVDPATTYANATPTARRLDLMSMRDWIERYVPNGLGSQLGRLIKESYRNEYGREIEELSALNLVLQLGSQRYYAQNHQMNVFGYWISDTSSLTEVKRSRKRLRLRSRPAACCLTAGCSRFKRSAGGSYELRFDHGARAKRSTPIESCWRFRSSRCAPSTISSAGFDSAKVNAIENLGYGYHTKLHLQFGGRAWMRAKHPWPEPTTGQIWTTLPMQSSLDYSLGQRGGQGLIEVFTAGSAAMLDTPPRPYAQIGDSAAVARHVRGFFEQLDRIWPGVSPTWNGKATFGNAQADPNILASYSCWLVGQCTTIAGHEARAQGRVHFAGEHTSVAYQGFMEGGAESGFRAAGEILEEYRVRTKRTAA